MECIVSLKMIQQSSRSVVGSPLIADEADMVVVEDRGWNDQEGQMNVHIIDSRVLWSV